MIESPVPQKRLIVHLDMDAFFAAIEQRDDPQLRGKPVVVGADPKGGKGRGVVSTCSYEARRFGIRSAMPISIAYRECPHAIFLPVNMEKYRSFSDQIHRILYDFTPDIEPVSIDEFFLDISTTFYLFGTPRQTCLLMKLRIRDETGLTTSIGLAPTKMAAKIASEMKKPDGFVEVSEAHLLDFLWPLDVGRLWGLGAKSQAILKDMGIETIGDLAQTDARKLVMVFGKNGVSLWQLANGIDDREVVTETETKSISNETTFERDTSDGAQIAATLMELSEKVSRRLRDEGLKGRTVTLKIRLEGFHTYTRATTLPDPTNFAEVLYREAKRLYEMFDTKGRKVRLVGIKASNLAPSDLQMSLFEDDPIDKKRKKIYEALDAINEKFGEGAIHRAR